MPTASPARWHTHGWNRELSWKLIFGILPRVPVFLRPLLHGVATTVCFAAMKNERRSARRNLSRVTGAEGLAATWLTWKLFYNFSKFMVAYTEMPPHGDGSLQGKLVGEGLKPLTDLLGRGEGAIVIGMHLGQWDLALAAISSTGKPVTVVMRREDAAVSRHAREFRVASGIEVVYAGEDPFMFVKLLAALRRNEVVAMHGDREMGGRSFTVPLCGGRVKIPAGPWELASMSGAPILAGVLVFEGHSNYRAVWADPIQVADRRGCGDGAKDPAIMGRAMEGLIRRYPEQWFNFYDLWPEEGGSE